MCMCERNKKQLCNLDRAVCNRERQRKHVNVIINEALSVLIKVKHHFAFSDRSVCAGVFISELSWLFSLGYLFSK